MKSKHDSWSLVNTALAGVISLCAVVVCTLLLNYSTASAGAIVIGQINPPGLTAGGAAGITFDGGTNPLVIDGFGRTIWRLDLHDASVISTFSLATGERNTRSLDFDGITGHYFTSRRFAPANDYLSTVDPISGIVTDIGVMGSFNFLDMAINPVTGDLWLVNDCANIGCTSVQGGSLWTVNKLTATATPVQTFGTSLGQLTALAISPEGKFFVTSFSSSGFSSVYEIDPITGKSTFITDTGLNQLSLLNDMAFDPSTHRLYAIEERRGVEPRAWYLVEVTGVPIPVIFAAFTAKLEITLGPRIDDAFELQSTFTLGIGSNGIDLSKDDVTLELKHGTASFTTTIPADSFKQDKKGRFEFEGTINGVSLEATLTPRRNNAYEFKAEGKHADLTGIANPVTVTLTIGNDSGSTNVRAKFDHDDGDHGDGEDRQH